MPHSSPLRVLETCLYAEDLDAAHDFYTGVLELKLHSRAEGRHVFLHCDTGMVLIFNPDATEVCDPDGIPCHGSRGVEHVCWAVEREDLDGWRDRLIAHGVAIEHEQSWPNGARSVYFRDPAGNSLEFATPRLWENDPD
ncbi:VOC family protein [Synoicihabitans lomoniglobus]|uniref:VOC family protein n=1 Tax=Synoicihabitans lomoniglobus TaxID=2909285 RepID=A0AAE9ZYW3_9BACT|nr:VOC family protein [Opitutaceae bacterium LMO-M01]WED65183.1 VOC family protein [Opitutaceae bacterium LMO-M01]